MLAALLLMAPVLTVDQVVARHGELNGTVIEVQGLLPWCRLIDCNLLSKKITFPFQSWKGHFLSIASSAVFDRGVRSYVGHRVVLTARFNDECVRAPCLDRPNTLTPIASHPLRLLGK